MRYLVLIVKSVHCIPLLVYRFMTAGGKSVSDRFILCEEMDEVYQSLDDADADDSFTTEAAELQQRHQNWLSQIDFNKYAHCDDL